MISSINPLIFYEELNSKAFNSFLSVFCYSCCLNTNYSYDISSNFAFISSLICYEGLLVLSNEVNFLSMACIYEWKSLFNFSNAA